MSLKTRWELGIVIKNDKAISHRSVLKILLNPLLRRFFGIAIASVIKDNKFVRYEVIKQKEPKSWNFKFDGDYDKII